MTRLQQHGFPIPRRRKRLAPRARPDAAELAALVGQAYGRSLSVEFVTGPAALEGSVEQWAPRLWMPDRLPEIGQPSDPDAAVLTEFRSACQQAGRSKECAAMAVVVEEFRFLKKNSLRAFARERGA